jgi:hypothetical protein
MFDKCAREKACEIVVRSQNSHWLDFSQHQGHKPLNVYASHTIGGQCEINKRNIKEVESINDGGSES